MDTPTYAQLLAEAGVVAFDLRGRLVSIERRHPQTGVETALIELRPGEAEAIIAARRAAQDRSKP